MTTMMTHTAPAAESGKPSFADRIRDTMSRLALDEQGAAAYLGVPIFTLRKWHSGERKPSAAVIRLLDVLGTVEVLSPTIHTSFLPSNPTNP